MTVYYKHNVLLYFSLLWDKIVARYCGPSASSSQAAKSGQKTSSASSKNLFIKRCFFTVFVSICCTVYRVKPVNEGHSKETQLLVFIWRLPRMGYWSMTFIYRMIVIQRWPLIQVWLYLAWLSLDSLKGT